jgi:hypothetical protein
MDSPEWGNYSGFPQQRPGSAKNLQLSNSQEIEKRLLVQALSTW